MTVWLSRAAVLAIHQRQIATPGGAAGLRDIALLEKALARPRHGAAYGQPDIRLLTAASEPPSRLLSCSWR